MLRTLWVEWRRYTVRLAEFQSAILLALSYLLLITPAWLVARVTRRRFLPYGFTQSSWLPRRSNPRTMRDLTKPY